MRGKYLFILLPVIGVLVLIAGRLFYFGPHNRSGRKEEILASTKLPDSSVLFLVQRPNPSRLEPYTVELYRLYQNGKAETCLVGHEESYWWGAGLKINDNKTVRITSVGITECRYDIETGVRIWTDKSYPPMASRQGDYAFLSNKVLALGYRF